MSRALVHGTAVAWGGDAVLLRGASGAGKSDLALRLIACDERALWRLQQPAAARESLPMPEPPLLIADDQVIITVADGALHVAAPETIRGLLEVRGLGILQMPYASRARLRLVVDLVPQSDVPRMPPETDTIALLGVSIARVRLYPFEASAALKCALALRAAVSAVSRS